MGVHIDWTPHPFDPGCTVASANGVEHGLVGKSGGNWYGWVIKSSTIRWPAENTESAARALVELAVRDFLEES